MAETKGLAWYERVTEERRELDQKLACLRAFIEANRDRASSTITADEYYRLLAQRGAMQDYSAILSARIAAFETERRR